MNLASKTQMNNNILIISLDRQTEHGNENDYYEKLKKRGPN